MWQIKAVVDEGERIPVGYGIAYIIYEKRRKVCYPFGLHLLVGLSLNLYFWLAFCMRKPERTLHRQAHKMGYRRGYEDGWEDGMSGFGRRELG